MPSPLTDRDLQEVSARGLAPDDVLRQLSLLQSPPPPPELSRPCRVNDGILALKPEEAAPLTRVFNKAREDGRLRKFVPASGAATRMFKDLAAWRSSGRAQTAEELAAASAASKEAAEVLKFFRNLRHFPFYEALSEALARRGQDPSVALREERFPLWADLLLGHDGLDYASSPKGVLPFHRYKGRPRTAFEEHLIESVDVLRDREGVCRVHFTASPEHVEPFKRLAAEAVPALEQARRCRFEVTFSFQSPATDTVALDAGGAPARSSDGKLLFRPGGHGALLENLNALQGDVVLMKNIDNVPHESHPGDHAHWDALLVGLLVELQEQVFHRITWLSTRPNDHRILEEAEFFAARRLNLFRAAFPAIDDEAADHKRRWEWLMARLNRPLRVCAVVRNTGEPGGGPFWVRGADGSLTPQIIESAQVAKTAEQEKVFRASTHFNPVNIVCGMRNWRGELFDLRAYADPASVFIAEKSSGGAPLRVLERPGLWNGGMAHWTTVFVETPLSTFHPVKTVNDLLRADHQPAVAGKERP
jgi:hypothetical protein